eukprot:4795163-Pyramimonas_sp.AAC.1
MQWGTRSRCFFAADATKKADRTAASRIAGSPIGCRSTGGWGVMRNRGMVELRPQCHGSGPESASLGATGRRSQI